MKLIFTILTPLLLVPLTLRYCVVALDGPFDAKRMSELTREWPGNR